MLIVAACGGRDRANSADEMVFEIDPAYIGPAYENPEIGFSYRPPVDWEILASPQREAVLDALAESRSSDSEYVLDVRDLFFNTETLSFSSVALVESLTADPVDRAQYVQAFAETIGLPEQSDEEAPLVARADFTVNDLPVTQFRHLQSERVTFTLLFEGKGGSLVQLDYSIPTSAYQQESLKLESSIGTLQRVSGE
jgi:hypothetical protein